MFVSLDCLSALSEISPASLSGECILHPPDPQMKRRPGKRAPDFIKPQPKNISIVEQIAQPEIAEFQTRRVARLYAVSFATAATIARLAYAVAR